MAEIIFFFFIYYCFYFYAVWISAAKTTFQFVKTSLRQLVCYFLVWLWLKQWVKYCIPQLSCQPCGAVALFRSHRVRVVSELKDLMA